MGHSTAECCKEAEGLTEIFDYGHTFVLNPFVESIISFWEIKGKLLTSGKLPESPGEKKIKGI